MKRRRRNLIGSQILKSRRPERPLLGKTKHFFHDNDDDDDDDELMISKKNKCLSDFLPSQVPVTSYHPNITSISFFMVAMQVHFCFRLSHSARFLPTVKFYF